jgi:hypothetical protein
MASNGEASIDLQRRFFHSLPGSHPSLKRQAFERLARAGIVRQQ